MHRKTHLTLAVFASLFCLPLLSPSAFAQNERHKTHRSAEDEDVVEAAAAAVAASDDDAIALDMPSPAEPAIASAASVTARRIGNGSVSGRLDRNSPRTEDGSAFMLYSYRGAPRSRVRIALDSDDFDTVLDVGSHVDSDCEDACRTDDDGGDGNNSLMYYTLPANGTIEIRARALESDDTGNYRLTITPVAADRISSLPIGRTTTGTLSSASTPNEDGRPHALWSLQGKPRQRLMVTMSSEQIDPYLKSGRMDEGEFDGDDSDDDSGPGDSAKLIVTLDDKGQALLEAMSASSDSSGRYEILASELRPLDPNKVGTLHVGDSISSKLDTTDWTGDDGNFGDLYRIEGRPGQRVVVNMSSNDFAALLQWGIVVDGGFSDEMSSRDGDEESSQSQIIVTLDSDGIGRLRVTSHDGGTGRYQLLVANSPRPSN